MHLTTFTSFTSKQTSSTPALETTPDHVESSVSVTVPSPVDDSATNTDNDPSSPVDFDEPQSLSQTFYPSLKDQRAFEHDRQRSKKAADLAKAKARKGQWSLLTYDSKRAFSRSPTRTPEKSKRFKPEEVEALETATTGNVRGDVTARRDRPTSTGDTKSEVKLADLISSGSVRKPRARKGKDSEYEVVPHVRSVIVLDDVVTHDVSFDEPWEHIDHSDSDDSDSAARKGSKKTYADILSVAK
ncbi:hypothetical protein VKT23_006481 [Stygiomarasmius scandens]|uniref:Uncharacterized protein n=1 Tax=Marasmiellus scandens TaxID=2682957 RepID=A0ABR1JNT1_9AGAR